MDPSTLLFGLATALLLLVALGLLVLGGAMTGGMMGGMAGMMGTPWGWAVLLAVVVACQEEGTTHCPRVQDPRNGSVS